MKGILADNNVIGPVEALIHQLQTGEWAEFWTFLGLAYKRFEDVGLLPESTDLEIWRICQAEQLILITDNQNLDSPDSLEATIREHNRPDSLPVFTDFRPKKLSPAPGVCGEGFGSPLRLFDVYRRGARNRAVVFAE